jgi:peptidylprolyl isomerase
MVLTLSAGACSTESTFTRTCYDVPHTVAEVRGDTVVTETGIRYIETFVGTGALVEECNDVSLRYTGELLDSTRFDEGSFTFVPGGGQVIAGFEQGVMGMRTEGIRRVIIPPELGYGDRPQHDPNTGDVLIPANSTILFDIEITNVLK